MGNTHYRSYSDWNKQNTNLGVQQGPLMLAYGATMPSSAGPNNMFQDQSMILIGAVQNLAKKNDLHYLYGRVVIPNRKYEYVMVNNDESKIVEMKPTYKLIGNEIIVPKNTNIYLENRYRTLIKSKHWDHTK